MKVETAELRHLEHCLRQDLSVGDNHRDIGLMGFKPRDRLRVAHRCRRQHGQVETARGLMHGRTPFRLAAPGRPWRLGIDGGDLVALTDDLQQRGDREVRRAHENDAQRRVPFLEHPVF